VNDRRSSGNVAATFAFAIYSIVFLGWLAEPLIGYAAGAAQLAVAADTSRIVLSSQCATIPRAGRAVELPVR
jgi:hypothetical protein